MNKEQFMELLDYYFRNVDETTYKEIKNDYEEHFRIGVENGKTEEEISTELGNPREIFNECKEAGIIRENNFFGMFNLHYNWWITKVRCWLHESRVETWQS